MSLRCRRNVAACFASSYFRQAPKQRDLSLFLPWSRNPCVRLHVVSLSLPHFTCSFSTLSPSPHTAIHSHKHQPGFHHITLHLNMMTILLRAVLLLGCLFAATSAFSTNTEDQQLQQHKHRHRRGWVLRGHEVAEEEWPRFKRYVCRG